MRYNAQNTRRLEALRREGGANAIDYLTVSDSTAATSELRQRILVVQLLQPLNSPTGAVLAPRDFSIAGGNRFPFVSIAVVTPGSAPPPGMNLVPLAEFDDPASLVIVQTDASDPSQGRGDHSDYVFAFTHPEDWGIDEQLASIRFQFKVECTSGFDCRCDCFCGAKQGDSLPDEPVIDYLAKDFGSFRRVILDRLSVLLPGWTERHSADLGVTLAELLAYVGDQLSYTQDAAATEAFLSTARDRVSLRRLARLLDYRPDEGSNARTVIQLTLKDDAPLNLVLPAMTPIFTGGHAAPAFIRTEQERTRLMEDPTTVVFETMESLVASKSLNEFIFWSWGELDGVLPEGATTATLDGAHPDLRVGDLLVITEVADPVTGAIDDADPTHRQVVRLTRVIDAVDAVGSLFDAGGPVLPSGPRAVTRIAWAAEDALSRPFCLTALGGEVIATRALGNVVLADHGQSIGWHAMPDVPPSELHWANDCAAADCDAEEGEDGSTIAPRYRPVVPTQTLIHAAALPQSVIAEVTASALPAAALDARANDEVALWLCSFGIRFGNGAVVVRGRDGAWSVDDGNRAVLIDRDGAVTRVTEVGAASRILLQSPVAAHDVESSDWPTPAILVRHKAGPEWQPRADLLGSGPDERVFVTEIDSAGMTRLRFGDGAHGLAPEPGSTGWVVRYREGRGTIGNVGVESLTTLDGSIDAQGAALWNRLGYVEKVTNPLPAMGGRLAETEETIRRLVPYAFREQRRAVTRADYAARAGSTAASGRALVQRAEATMRWTGSWYTQFLAIDPIGSIDVPEELAARIVDHVDDYRMMGEDLEIDGAVYVPLTIELDVCASAGSVVEDVQRRLLSRLQGGRRGAGNGFFSADRLTFGQDVLLSPLVAAAAATEGVASVTVREFHRSMGDTRSAIASGVIPISRLEIAQCDNDPDFPDRGVISVAMRGGR